MNYRVYYITDNGKRFVDKVEAYSEKDAEKQVRNKYNDIEEIVKVERV